MKTILNKYFYFLKTLFLVLFCIVIASGCDKLKVSVYTDVSKDGSIFRQIEFIFKPTDTEQLKYIKTKMPDLLEKGFVLPAEPEWKISKYVKNDAFYYVAQKTFAKNEDIKSDYYKKSQYNGASQNFVSFDISEYGKNTEYNYLEIYRDSADIVKFSNVFTQYLQTNKKSIANKLFKSVSSHNKSFTQSDSDKVIEIFLDNSSKVRDLVNKFNIIGPKEKRIISQELKNIDLKVKLSTFIDILVDNQKMSANNSSPLVNLFHLSNADPVNKKEALYNILKNFVKEEFTSISIANNIDPLGAFYTNLDMLNKYSFECKLKLPGIITNSNGNRINENTIQWSFEPEDFFNHDYVIIAKSKDSK